MVAKCCFLMYEISQKRNKHEILLQWLEKAKEFQLKAIKKAQLENPDAADEYRKMLTTYENFH